MDTVKKDGEKEKEDQVKNVQRGPGASQPTSLGPCTRMVQPIGSDGERLLSYALDSTGGSKYHVSNCCQGAINRGKNVLLIRGNFTRKCELFDILR